MMPPDSRCEPGVLPFSISATGTSPRLSESCGSVSSSCISRIAHDSPAGPPPTIATPTSIRSSSGSVGGPTNSFEESTGGGNWIGATDKSAALLRLDRLGQLGDDLVQVAHHAEVRELEDRRVRVRVDRDDVLRVLHADLVLDRAGDPDREVQLRRDGLARLADLSGVRVPAGVDHSAGGGNRAAERVGQVLGQLEALGLPETAAAADQQVGVLDVHVRAALLAALDDRGPGREVRQRHVDVLDLGRGAVAGVLDLERVEAADDDPDVARVVHVDDRGVLEDRALGHELAVLDLHGGDLHGHAGAEARGEARADLEAEQSAAEQRVLVAVVLDQLGHDVDHRLGQPLRRLRAPDLRRAVVAERGAELVAQVVAPDDDRVGLAAELLRQLTGLGDGAQGVLVELALVVKNVGEDAHASSFLSSSQDTIFWTVSSVSSSSMISPACFSGGGLIESTAVREPCSPTWEASMPTSPAAFESSCFFFAPMIALSDG